MIFSNVNFIINVITLCFYHYYYVNDQKCFLPICIHELCQLDVGEMLNITKLLTPKEEEDLIAVI